MNTRLWLVFLVGFMGGICGALLITGTAVHAEKKGSSFNEATFYNTSGTRIGYLGPGNSGQGSMWLYDADGREKLMFGTYGAAHEKGQPAMGLYDDDFRLRALWRLYGASSSPALVFKDKSGDDRIVIGLRGNQEEPYFEYINSLGQRINLIK